MFKTLFTHNLYKKYISAIFIYRQYCIIKPIESISPVPTASKEYLVPQKPVKSKIDLNKLPPRTSIDASTIAHLERLSLVDCANKQGIETLEEAIAFADQILDVNTEGVQPLITVLEDLPLQLREDKVTEGNCREDVLSNAILTEDDYFVAPPGNIPLEPRQNLLHQEESDHKDAI